MDLYGEIILDHYKNPHHHGRLAQPSISARDTNPLCGDEIQLDLLIDDQGQILEIGFAGIGCAISQASTSMLSDELIGKSLAEAEQITNEDIYELLGVPLTPSRVKCALLGLVTMKKALTLYKLNRDE